MEVNNHKMAKGAAWLSGSLLDCQPLVLLQTGPHCLAALLHHFSTRLHNLERQPINQSTNHQMATNILCSSLPDSVVRSLLLSITLKCILF